MGALEQAVAAPLATTRLAEAGARTIKIESAYFVWLNRGMKSVVLDIKQQGNAALLQRMVAKADVSLQNLAPGAASRAEFGSAELRARYPHLITCDISGPAT